MAKLFQLILWERNIVGDKFREGTSPKRIMGSAMEEIKFSKESPQQAYPKVKKSSEKESQPQMP